MTGKKQPIGNVGDLRTLAEQRLASAGTDVYETLSIEDARRLLHELRVHQIELEMQNEQLRRTHVELEISRARYFDLYDMAPVGYVTISEAGFILQANLAAADLLGKQRQDLTNHLFTGFVLPDDQDIYYLHCKQLFATREAHSCELRLLKPEGKGAGDFWVRIDARVVENSEHKEPVCWSVMCDISVRKRQDAERAELESRLRLTGKLEAIGHLAGGVAHEFNNMLTIINGYSDLVIGYLPLSDPHRDKICQILAAGQRAAGISSQLLTFARKQSRERRVVDFNQLVAETLKMLRPLIGENITLHWLPGAQPCPVNMDPSQVNQILINLLVNARDAIAGIGSITLTTELQQLDATFHSAHPEFKPGTYVMLMVKDDGCGMDAETCERVFEPFFTTKGVGKGTGLGLATVYGIIKQNDGEILVTSEKGTGTSFMVFLPQASLEQMKNVKMGTELPPTVGTETVLVVEDDPSVMKLATDLLGRLGYSVIHTSSPLEAIRLVKEFPDPIHLLLTDVLMPEMNGRELQKQIVGLRPSIRCIFMSGYSISILGELEGKEQFLQKPFTLSSLSAKLRKALQDKSP
ncbi:MAG: ATP-binding protein [Candidatus Ozemobacteraceae bacterium]